MSIFSPASSTSVMSSAATTTSVPSILDIPTEPTSGLQNFAIVIVFFFPALALLVIIARDAGRLSSHQFGLDDWLISIAMLLSIVETFTSYCFLKTNFVGIHESQIPPHDLTNSLIWNFAVQILYNPILALAKSSVLFFLLRLFGQKGGIRKLIIGLNMVNLTHMVIVFFAVVFQCQPIAFNWDKTIQNGHCLNQGILFVTTSAFNIFTDLAVLGLPLFILSDLKIPRRTKFGLMFIFLLGFLVTISSIARMVILVQGIFHLAPSADPTVNIGFVTSAIETNLAIITASIPALRPFLRTRERGGWLPTFGAGGAGGGSGAGTGGGGGGRRGDTEMGAGRLTRSATTYTSRTSTSMTASGKRPASVGNGARGRNGSRRGRGGGGGGGRGGGKGSRKPANLPDIRIKTERELLRSQSPRSSEEEAMTSNGIMRVSDIQREIDGLARELTAVSGYGGYSMADVAKAGRAGGGGGGVSGGGLANSSTSLATSTSKGRRFADQHYETADPDAEYRGERDFNEERLSRYGERRFGVVTPKGVPPQWTGRPF